MKNKEGKKLIEYKGLKSTQCVYFAGQEMRRAPNSAPDYAVQL